MSVRPLGRTWGWTPSVPDIKPSDRHHICRSGYADSVVSVEPVSVDPTLINTLGHDFGLPGVSPPTVVPEAVGALWRQLGGPQQVPCLSLRDNLPASRGLAMTDIIYVDASLLWKEEALPDIGFLEFSGFPLALRHLAG